MQELNEMGSSPDKAKSVKNKPAVEISHIDKSMISQKKSLEQVSRISHRDMSLITSSDKKNISLGD